MSFLTNKEKEEFELTRKRVMERWGDEISHPKLRAKVSFDQSIQILIEKCMTCDEELFNYYVHRLLWSVPETWRDDEFEEELEETTETVEYTTPVMNCGVPVSPDVIQGAREEMEETDYRKVFNAILNLCNRLNLLIAKEITEVITDKVESSKVE